MLFLHKCFGGKCPGRTEKSSERASVKCCHRAVQWWRERDIPFNERGASCGTKRQVQLWHWHDQMLREHHVRKVIRTEQSTELKSHDYCGTGLTKFYHIMIFLGKIHSTSQVTWTSEFWGVSSGELCLVRALSLQNSQGQQMLESAVFHGWVARKKGSWQETWFPQIVKKNQ